MAATRLIAMHQNKGRSLQKCLKDRTDYAQNPEKTEGGELVCSYQCDPEFVEEQFASSKKEYLEITGRKIVGDIIAYQIRQSFKPGEITPEEANKIGYETAMRWTKGQHAFIVATHVDKAHIHNHIIYNSTTLDCTRKFKDFYFSALAVRRISDILCFEHGMSIIKAKPYRDREKYSNDKYHESFRDEIRAAIDFAIQKKPKDFDELLNLLEREGYEIKRGKHTAIRGKGQKKFLRFRSFGIGYTEPELRETLAGNTHHEQQRKKWTRGSAEKINLLIDIQKKINEGKGVGYERWAKNFNLKQMAKALCFLQEHGIEDYGKLVENTDDAVLRFNSLSEEIKAKEKRLAEIAVLRKHIINYSKTREIYVQYRKSGYSKKFFEAHREDITIHKAAKDAFNEFGVKKIPRVKELNEEYATLLAEKKKEYALYRSARNEMQEFLIARKNIEALLGEEAERHPLKENDRSV